MDSVERLEDMSERGRLRMIWQPDGDLILECVENDGRSSAVEFCNDGTRSPRTLRALRILFLAMQADARGDITYGRSDDIEKMLLDVGTELQQKVRR